VDKGRNFYLAGDWEERLSGGVKRDQVKPWFEALEEMDEFVGIRYGHLAAGKEEPEWEYVPHTLTDGIGGLARLLGDRGGEFGKLPEMKHGGRVKLAAILRMIPGLCRSRKSREWLFEQDGEASRRDRAPQAVSWHLFSEKETRKICEASQALAVSVNSFLLRHLDSVVRGELINPAKAISWMVPVNLRRGELGNELSGNFSGYVTARIREGDAVGEVHAEVQRNLSIGQHVLTNKSYSVGRFLWKGLKKNLIRMNRVMAEPYLGAFSNLGRWDCDGVDGHWFFCPPVLRCQMIGAGCVTYRDRLSLTLQVHPELSVDPGLPAKWMNQWSETIKLDFR